MKYPLGPGGPRIRLEVIGSHDARLGSERAGHYAISTLKDIFKDEIVRLYEIEM